MVFGFRDPHKWLRFWWNPTVGKLFHPSFRGTFRRDYDHRTPFHFFVSVVFLTSDSNEFLADEREFLDSGLKLVLFGRIFLFDDHAYFYFMTLHILISRSRSTYSYFMTLHIINHDSAYLYFQLSAYSYFTGLHIHISQLCIFLIKMCILLFKICIFIFQWLHILISEVCIFINPKVSNICIFIIQKSQISAYL